MSLTAEQKAEIERRHAELESGAVRGYTLAELIRRCDLSVPRREEDCAWLEADPVGREEI